jgi:pectin lyase
VTISNNYFNGVSSYSATCDGYHYWGIYLTGSSDLITFKGNYVYHMSGRAPKVGGNTLLHAVSRRDPLSSHQRYPLETPLSNHVY